MAAAWPETCLEFLFLLPLEFEPLSQAFLHWFPKCPESPQIMQSLFQIHRIRLALVNLPSGPRMFDKLGLDLFGGGELDAEGFGDHFV